MSSWLSLSKSDGDQTPNPVSSGGVLIKEAFSHHLRSVAAFLAPPPPPPPNQHHNNSNSNSNTITCSSSSSSSQTISGIKKDFAEIEETFKSSLSLLSTKFTSTLLNFAFTNNNDNDNDNNDEYRVAGINEEVVDFVRQLSSRPEFWTEFPICLPTDYDMSECQREHGATVEQLVPSLVNLRQKYCSHLSDGQFWMIYFTILLPRLNENDLNDISTPEIVEVRETLLRKLQKEKNTMESSTHTKAVNSDEKQGDSLSHQNISAETLCASQEVETVNSQKPDQWLENEDSGPSTSIDAHRQAQNKEDDSFSNLEVDEKDLSDNLSGFRHKRNEIVSQNESSEWIQLTEKSGAEASKRKPGPGQSGLQGRESEGESSSDWQHVDDVDCESLASD